MKALVLEDYMKLTYKDVPDPVPGPDEVLVEVRATGICGSDVHGMDGSTGRRIPPVIMGHEASGIIRDTGSRVGDWKAGDRVTFDSTIYDLGDWYSRRGNYNLSDGRMVLGVSTKEFKRDGTYADFVAVPSHILYRIPENVSFARAAMVEPAAVALHAVNLTPVAVNDTAVVVGAGMIGLFVIQMLRLAGCTEIAAVDIDEEKLSLAEKLGATLILDPKRDNIATEIKNISGGRGADIAFEAVGISSTLNTAISALRKGGTLTILGNISPSVEIPLQTVVTGQLQLQGSCAINGEYGPVLGLLEKDLLNTDVILSAEAPLAEGADWFRRLYGREKGLNKVILIP
ncbi:MAG: galactitol-1-phosphate 5-dehydrogenase [Marinilabiliales bacterium]|nr:MAG: galactitol-1-phosphate 5-dehydrogenase [Marinilabiliales bacterium]